MSNRRSGRMVIFCTYNYWYPLAVYRLILAGTFLTKLLGWKPFISGLVCCLLIYPASQVMSKRYAKIQFGLMKYRDAKAHILTEALQGMRQIKYSALEQLFEKKILQSRDEELGQFWRAAKWMCSLTLMINAAPVLLSCISLAVFSLTTPELVRPSVIFASLGLFDQLEEAIASLPVIQVYMMEAWTSCVRVEKFLNQPEKALVADPGETIVFDKATVRWPRIEDSDTPDANATVPSPDGESSTAAPAEETRSILRNINVQFPTGKLSLITGKTGSGKSLLLAAILGEVKLLSGKIQVPEAPPVSIIESKDIGESNWILPSLTAFVSQTPWVESGTLRENILFGMPYRESRYQKVLEACALEKDVELLADGDETEVGPKGVTLSGGQRWRVALARALYSRAGILVLDDVLSAVDAHVGRTIVNVALTGDLAKGRTRILATHHPEMCLAHATRLVRLDNGRVLSVEEVTEAQEGASLTALEPTDVGSSPSSEPGDAGEQPTADSKKKSDDEEKRESGRVRSRVYREYLKAGKSLHLWAIFLVLLTVSRLLSVATTWSLKQLSSSYIGAPSSEPSGQPSSMASHMFVTQASDPEWEWHAPGGKGAFLSATPSPWTQSGDDSAFRKNIIFWITAYVICDYSTLFVSIAMQLVVMLAGLRTSRVLFERMTHSILRAPLRWVDTVPAGRVLNRFTSDTYTVDRRLASDLSSFLQGGMGLVFIIAARSVNLGVLFLSPAFLRPFTDSVFVAARTASRSLPSPSSSALACLSCMCA